MFEYIKQPYVPTVAGITNTRTGWKLTSDPQGLVIVEETPLSVDTLNRLTSDIIVSAGNTIYIWYKMELSNNEVKDYVGPIPFVSREDNITSDLKPITRVNTPSVLWDDNNLYSGYNNMIMKSSEFSGDALDGHLATTWVFKTPDDIVLDYYIKDMTNKYQVTLNRSALAIDKYDYIKAYIKHHSANGSTSDFGMTIIPTNVYPFKFVGENIFNSRLPYNFTITPFNIAIPNISEIRIVNVKDNTIKYSFTNMSTLSFTIPAYTLDVDSSYYIQCFVTDTVNGKYPVMLNVLVHTKIISNSVQYSNLIEYALSGITTATDTTVDINYLVRDKLVNNRLISYDTALNRFSLHILNLNTSELDTSTITHNTAIDALIENDYRIFNLSNGMLILITRVGTSIKIYRLKIVGGIIVVDTTFTVIESIVTNTNHNIANTATLSEDEKYVYFVSIKSTYIELGKGNISTSTYSVLTNRPELTTASYNPLNMVLQTIGDKKLISFGGSGDLWYYYNEAEHQWIAMGKLPTTLVADTSTSYRVLLLGDRSILLCSDYGTPKNLIRFKPNMDMEILALDLALRSYNIFTIDAQGIVYGYSYSLNSRLKLIPTNLI